MLAHCHDQVWNGHPKVGVSWEGFVLSEVLIRLGARPEEAFFRATYAGAELDLLAVRGRRKLGFEVRRTTAPAITRSALETLGQRLDVVHAGSETFALGEGIRAVAHRRLLKNLEPL